MDARFSSLFLDANNDDDYGGLSRPRPMHQVEATYFTDRLPITHPQAEHAPHHQLLKQ